jgi:hypothetical protein
MLRRMTIFAIAFTVLTTTPIFAAQSGTVHPVRALAPALPADQLPTMGTVAPILIAPSLASALTKAQGEVAPALATMTITVHVPEKYMAKPHSVLPVPQPKKPYDLPQI